MPKLVKKKNEMARSPNWLKEWQAGPWSSMTLFHLENLSTGRPKNAKDGQNQTNLKSISGIFVLVDPIVEIEDVEEWNCGKPMAANDDFNNLLRGIANN
jgi:hypothetical protein